MVWFNFSIVGTGYSALQTYLTVGSFPLRMSAFKPRSLCISVVFLHTIYGECNLEHGKTTSVLIQLPQVK